MLHRNTVRVPVLVSREACRDPENRIMYGSLAFFHTIDEYERLAKECNWNDTEQRRHSWFSRPRKISVLVYEDDYRRFLEGQELACSSVYIPVESLDEVAALGVWQQG